MLFSCLWSQLGNVDSNNVNDLPTYLPSEKVSLIFFKFTNMEFRKHKYFPICEKKKAKKQLNGKKSKFQNWAYFCKKNNKILKGSRHFLSLKKICFYETSLIIFSETKKSSI